MDFDLANWVDDSSGVHPVVKEGAKDGLTNSDRHEAHDFHGVVGSLAGTSPTQSFTIALRAGGWLCAAVVLGGWPFFRDLQFQLPEEACGDRGGLIESVSD